MITWQVENPTKIAYLFLACLFSSIFKLALKKITNCLKDIFGNKKFYMFNSIEVLKIPLASRQVRIFCICILWDRYLTNFQYASTPIQKCLPVFLLFLLNHSIVKYTLLVYLTICYRLSLKFWFRSSILKNVTINRLDKISYWDSYK